MMRKMVLLTAAVMLGLVFMGGPSMATPVTITYGISPQGGNSYQYSYTVQNGGGDPVIDFMVYFDKVWPVPSGLYTSIAVGSLLPPAWSGTATQWSAIDLGGYVEYSTTGSGIAAGDSLGLFTATFNYGGSGIPGSQYFEIYDANFNLVDSGQTSLPGATVPLPGTLLLLASGGCSLFGLARRRLGKQ